MISINDRYGSGSRQWLESHVTPGTTLLELAHTSDNYPRTTTVLGECNFTSRMLYRDILPFMI